MYVRILKFAVVASHPTAVISIVTTTITIVSLTITISIIIVTLIGTASSIITTTTIGFFLLLLRPAPRLKKYNSFDLMKSKEMQIQKVITCGQKLLLSQC